MADRSTLATRPQIVTPSAEVPKGIVHSSETHEVPWWLPPPAMRDLPNAGDGTWDGEFPLSSKSPAPPHPVPVVYSLFDAEGLCYIGSTDDLRERLKVHAKGGKHFTRWTAQAFRSRKDAYRNERELISRYKPRLNTTYVATEEITWTTAPARRRGRLAVSCGLCNCPITPGAAYSISFVGVACRPCTERVTERVTRPATERVTRVGSESGQGGPGLEELPAHEGDVEDGPVDPWSSPPGGVDLATGEIDESDYLSSLGVCHRCGGQGCPDCTGVSA